MITRTVEGAVLIAAVLIGFLVGLLLQPSAEPVNSGSHTTPSVTVVYEQPPTGTTTTER